MLGAAGVWVGTRFVATDEAAAPPHHKKKICGAGHSTDTIISEVLSGRPIRLLPNGWIKEYEEGLVKNVPEQLERKRKMKEEGELPVYIAFAQAMSWEAEAEALRTGENGEGGSAAGDKGIGKGIDTSSTGDVLWATAADKSKLKQISGEGGSNGGVASAKERKAKADELEGKARKLKLQVFEAINSLAGQGVYGVKKTVPCAVLVSEMVRQCSELLPGAWQWGQWQKTGSRL